ncbi:MAG: GcrA family cell cycle regulator [Rhodospirillaceae bacterium]
MSWSDEQIEVLKTLWGEGKPASEIAEILGNTSSNAVIGKAHRLRLYGCPSPIENKTITSRLPALLTITERMCKWPFGYHKKYNFHFCV